MICHGEIISSQRRYRLYIDESGDHTFQLTDDDNHRYLGLLGLWFETDIPYKAFSKALNDLKQDIFDRHPDDPVICLHRKDLVAAKAPSGGSETGISTSALSVSW